MMKCLQHLWSGVLLLMVVDSTSAGDISLQLLARQESWVLSSSKNELQWVNVKEVAPDGILHIEVLSSAPAGKPWAFKRLANHMAISREALQASAIREGSYGDCYPEAYFWARKAWGELAEAGKAPVCTTNIVDCLKLRP